MTQKNVTELNFEEAMQALEALVIKLESGQVSLEDSIDLYEHGAALKKHCENKLKSAEEKVAKITLDQAGKPAGLTPMTD